MSVNRGDSPSTEQRKRYVEIIIIFEKLVDLNEHENYSLKKLHYNILSSYKNFYPGYKQVKLLYYSEYNLLNDNTVTHISNATNLQLNKY